VGAQNLGDAAAVQPCLLADLLEEADHAFGVIAGISHGLDADAIGLVLVGTRVADLPLVAHGLTQRQRADDHVRVGGAGDDGCNHAEPGGNVGNFGVLSRTCQVPLRDVRQLVTHDAGHFAFAIGREQQAGVEADVTAGHRECVDAGVVDHEEGQFGRSRRAVGGQAPTHRRNVVGQLRIFEDVAPAIELAHDACAEQLLLRGRQRVVGRLADVGQVERGRRHRRRCRGGNDGGGGDQTRHVAEDVHESHWIAAREQGSVGLLTIGLKPAPSSGRSPVPCARSVRG
jgi:hypothetical protein